MNNQDNLKKESIDLEDISNHYISVMKEIEDEQEQYWSSLPMDDQLKVFCAVVRRICQAELIDKGSYRHALYGVFGFGPEAYARAQEAGYLGLHNAIVDEEYDRRLLKAFCTRYNIEDGENKITEFGL
jgi:hypothetical protein